MEKSKFIKTYTIMVSKTYPAYHSMKGQSTYFQEKILLGLFGTEKMNTVFNSDYSAWLPKKHTFRGNYDLWKKRIDEVLAGEAIIVLKYHTLGRYVKGNKQIEFARFDSTSSIGIEKVKFIEDIKDYAELIDENGKVTRFLQLGEVAENDGLKYPDFKEWFEKGDYNMSESFACIHFTPLRYEHKTTI